MKVQYIADLLFSHECVIVPGLGGFLTSYAPAHLDRMSNRFYPPSCEVAFNASLSANDGILANHIASSSGITYREALYEIRKWVDQSFRLLHSGEKLYLDGIGYLRLNEEGNLLFEPELKMNFLGNSFGLPSFYAKTVIREEVEFGVKEIKRVQTWPSKIKYLLPETLKWVAVLAPFVAFTLWGSLNTGRIGNYVQNYSGLFSWVRTTPGKNATLPSNTITLPPRQIKQQEITSPAAILSKTPVPFSPTAISYSAIRAEGLLLSDIQDSTPSATAVEENNYFIIGGAFREQVNAKKMLDDLLAKGYPASIIDTTRQGMFVVGIKGFSSRSSAVNELSDIRNAGYTNAWIMHKG